MPRELSVDLLGEPRLAYGSEPWRFVALPKSLPVLAYLLLHRGKVLQRDTLAFQMWPDETESGALSNLRRHLHRLAGALPQAPARVPWLLTTRTTVSWNVHAPCRFDVSEYERLAADEATVDQAEALYRGDFLHSCYDDWAIAERERLRVLHVQLLARLVARFRRERNFPRAIGYADAACRLDPFGEQALRTAMVVRHDYGDRAGAVALFERFAQRLRTELNAEPMPETIVTYDRIVRDVSDSPATEPNSAAAHPRKRRGAPLAFVGRERELARLTRAWSRAAMGHGTALVISGEAGIGKTRLAQEVAALADAQGGSVFVGTTAPQAATPYQPFAEALRMALPILVGLELDDVWLASIGGLVPEVFARRPGLAPVEPLEERRDQLRLFEAVVRSFEAAARGRPRVVILEDLHWADAATIALWEFVARRAGGFPLLLIATIRDEEAPLAHPVRAAFRRLQAGHEAEEIALDALTEQDVSQLVARLPEALRQRAPAARELHRSSEGNPFVLGLTLESGAGARHHADLAGLLRARLAGLSPEARSVAETAAVVGQGFDVAVVREMCAWPQARVLDALDELLDRKLIRDASAFVATDYAFAHHLIANHVYGTLDVDRRVRTHRRAGRVLAALLPERGEAHASEVARHLDLGGLGSEAATFYVRAARAAYALFANDEALRLARRAAELAEAARLRFDALTALEDVHDRIGDREAQAVDLDALEVAVDELDDPAARFEVARRRVNLLAARARTDDEAAAIEALERLAGESGDPIRVAEAQLARAKQLQATGDLAAAAGATEDAADALLAGGLTHRAVLALGLGAGVDASLGEFDRARERLDRAERAAADARDAVSAAAVVAARATVDFIARDFPAAGAGAARVLAECERIGDRAGAADAHARLATIETRRFRFAEAREHFGRARAIYASLGDRRGGAIVSMNAGITEFGVADFSGAVRLFTEALEGFEALGDLRGEALAASNAALASLRSDDVDEAARLAQKGLASSDRLNSPIVRPSILSNVGEVALRRGQLAVAVETFERGLEERRRTTGALPDIAEDLGCLARAYVAAGRREEARACAEELVRLLPQLDEALFFPQLLWWAAACALHAAGAGDAAREAAVAAEERFRARLERLGGTDRERYGAVVEHAEILAAVRENRWPDLDGARTV